MTHLKVTQWSHVQSLNPKAPKTKKYLSNIYNNLKSLITSAASYFNFDAENARFLFQSAGNDLKHFERIKNIVQAIGKSTKKKLKYAFKECTLISNHKKQILAAQAIKLIILIFSVSEQNSQEFKSVSREKIKRPRKKIKISHPQPPKKPTMETCNFENFIDWIANASNYENFNKSVVKKIEEYTFKLIKKEIFTDALIKEIFITMKLKSDEDISVKNLLEKLIIENQN